MDLVKEALVKEIANKLRHNNVLLEAPMGWGKTTLMFHLAILLAKEGWRVGVVAPTLTLLVNKWPQLQQMLSSTQSPPRVILTAGAGQYCVYKWENPQRHCHRCRLRRNFVVDVPAVKYDEIENMVPEDVCGYWAQESSLENYSIMLGHYGRLPKLIRHMDILLVDEAHELYLPHIITYDLYEIATLLGNVDVEKLNIDDIRELVEERLMHANDPLVEDKLWAVRNALRKTCWIEKTLNCLDTYNLPQIRTFAVTATPPPGWPPEGWGEKIEIKPTVKPKAYVETSARFYYKDNYEGAALLLNLVVRWLRREYNVEEIAVFATSSLREKLQYSLPPGVQLFPAGG